MVNGWGPDHVIMSNGRTNCAICGESFLTTSRSRRCPDCSNVVRFRDTITRLEARVAELEGALRAAYEVYAGSDGFIPETCAEGYLQQIIRQMVDCIGTALTQPAPSPWRPIETAPKDGTVVLVFAAARDGLSAFQCTAAYHEDAGWCVDELREATHWMPLPPPPEKGGE
jgi:hypothetical protein